jgi:hypothetical protein
MPASLAAEIFEFFFTADKPAYRAVLAKVAEARNVRPVYLERQPRSERHKTMAGTLARPAMEAVAANLLQGWLLKKHAPMLGDFLDALAIPHKDGMVEDLPATVPDDRLQPAVATLLAKYPKEVVAVYLHAFNSMNETKWENLDALLQQDARLQF